MSALTFSDVLISPGYSEIRSRKEVNIESNIFRKNLSLPIIAANMKSICGKDMAVAMYKNGGIGILHRFNEVGEAVREYVETSSETGIKGVGVSIGVQESDKIRFEKLYSAGARIFTIDVAHGYHILVKEMLEYIRRWADSDDCYIIAGNVATAEGAIMLAKWGANCVKVGIGPGRGCTTRKNTGVGVPQLYALKQICESNLPKDIGIISDGGITATGDIPKALKYADAVMVGSFIAGTTETPGKVFKDENGQYYKVYSGSASGENKNENGQPTDFVEGISIKIPFRGKVKYVLKEAEEGIKSAFSYVGARNMKEFKDKCKFIEISGGAKSESKM